MRTSTIAGNASGGGREQGTVARQDARAGADERPGALATVLAIYVAVVIGRVGNLLHLGNFPVAKILAACALIVALSNIRSLSRVRIGDIRLARLALAFMAWIACSLAFSIWHAETLRVITGTVVATTVSSILIIKCSAKWSAVRRMLLGTVGATLALSVAAMLTSFAGRAGSDRTYDPNDFAYVLVGLLPCACAFITISKGWRRALFAGIALWAIVAILLTQSRGGLLGLTVDVVALTLFFPSIRKGPTPVSPSRGELLARMLTVCLVGITIWHEIPGDARARLETITTADQGYNVTSEGGRVQIWERNLPLIVDRPWGYGANAFSAVDGIYAGGNYKAPHNVFLQALIELGVPGLLMFAWLLIVYFSQVRTLAVPAQGRWSEPAVFARALGISQAGLCVSGFFLTELYSNELWLTVALLCAIAGNAGVLAGRKARVIPPKRTIRYRAAIAMKARSGAELNSVTGPGSCGRVRNAEEP